jgi:hypothetical protein
MDEIVKLKRQVSALIEISKHLFTLAGSTQRFTDASEFAAKEIPRRLEHAQNPDT